MEESVTWIGAHLICTGGLNQSVLTGFFVSSLGATCVVAPPDFGFLVVVYFHSHAPAHQKRMGTNKWLGEFLARKKLFFP